MDDTGTDGLADEMANASEALVGRVLQFAQLVRSHGIPVTSGRVIDAQRSLRYIDLARRDDFYHALRANLIAGPDDIVPFDALFDRFWSTTAAPESSSEGPPRAQLERPSEERTGEGSTGPPQRLERLQRAGADEETEHEGPTYSGIEVLMRKDFSTLDASELRQIQKIMARMAPKLLRLRSRRFRAGTNGSRLDFPRTLRQSLHTGGDMIDLSWRRRRVDTAHLVLLCDVSHSMEQYSRFLIQFMYAFQNELPSTETFAFSTRLTRLTTALRGRRLDDALDEAASASAGWSSGTKIGACLEQFNTREGQGMLDRRTVVVILSDGWDQGDPRLLGEQMAAIKRRSRTIIWLNPLLGDSRYQPLVSGMRAALPHIDLFLPCHNLASLQEFAVQLSRV
jgi:uncharacterized protein with von Willebrand factor type A (vWA) domain